MGFDPRLLATAIKIDGPKHIAVVCLGQGRKAQFLGPLHQIGNANGPVQEGILGMQVQVDKTLWTSLQKTYWGTIHNGNSLLYSLNSLL